LSIRRMASHSIIEKQPKDQCSVADTTNELLTFSIDQQKLILKRLQDAMGRKGKGFYLEIGDASPRSFFGHCHDMNKLNDEIFIKRTQDIAHMLAGVQTHSKIKSGYLNGNRCN
jgi:hypothetical protein